MINFLNDLWQAFRAALRAARLARRGRQVLGPGGRQRAVNHAARLATISSDDLRRCATSWHSEPCRRELDRRGQP